MESGMFNVTLVPAFVSLFSVLIESHSADTTQADQIVIDEMDATEYISGRVQRMKGGQL
jgi:hypothetical protein